MDAMVLNAAHAPLELLRVGTPVPAPRQLLVKVDACGVCRTDLHVIDGELPHARSPVIPGHEIVGTVVDAGAAVDTFARGDRVGIPWLASTCGVCAYCRAGRENLCDNAQLHRLHGRRRIRGVRRRRSPLLFSRCRRRSDDGRLAPWLCAGLIGYRALHAAGEARRLGIYGFGAAAHIVAQLARHQGREVFAFTRPGDAQAQEFARTLGAVWAGDAMWPRRRRWMRRSFSLPSARWCRLHCAAWRRAARSSARAST